MIRRLLYYLNIKQKPIRRINLQKINKNTTVNLMKLLSSINSNNSYCVFLTVNSGCELGDALQISGLMQDFKKRKNSVPVYTFAEDAVIGANLLIYLSGSKCFAHSCSLFGFYDLIYQKSNKKDLIEFFGMKFDFITSGENKARLNSLKEFKEEDLKWMQNILYARKESFIKQIAKSKDSIDKNLIENKEMLSFFLGSRLITAEEMKSKGFIDDFGTVESIRKQMFNNRKIVKAEEKITFEDLIQISKEGKAVFGRFDEDYIKSSVKASIEEAVNKQNSNTMSYKEVEGFAGSLFKLNY